MDPRALDAHVALRLAALSRHEDFLPSPRAARAVREFLAALHSQGTVRVFETGGQIQAVWVWRHDEQPWCGDPVSAMAIDHVDPSGPAIERWLSSTLEVELRAMKAPPMVQVAPWYTAARRALQRRGFGVDSITLLGRPGVALSRLISDRPIRALPSNLRFEPMLPKHVDPVLELQREVFTASPEFCFFGANKRYLRDRRPILLAQLEPPDHLERVLLLNDEPVGHVGATVDPDNAFWGPCAGMSLLLAPRLQGRGLLRALYATLLSGMVERGARTFKGGTNQPPVLKLARVMGRPLESLLMRPGGSLQPRQLAPFLP